MVNSDKPRDNQAADKFIKELYFLAYLAHKSVQFGNQENYCITRHTKIAVNYFHDWPSSEKHKPNIVKKAKPFGMVAAINESPSAYPVYIYDKGLGDLAERACLWRIRNQGNFKQVEVLSNPETLRKILSKPEPKHNFECGLMNYQFGLVDSLAHIYSKFSTEELNILASHRDYRDSYECILYELVLWETNFQDFWLKNPWNEGLTSENVGSICKMAIACEQIEIKIDYIFNKIQNVIKKLHTLHDLDEFVDSDRYMLLDIIEKSEKNSRLPPGYGSIFSEKYSFNREYLYPLTMGIYQIGKILERRNSAAKISNKKEIDQMILHLSKEPVIKTKIDQKMIEETEFQLLVDKITQLHSEAKKKNTSELRPFTKNHPKERDWEISDGRISDV